MKLTFIGGAKTVTGVCYLLETANQKILIDCGLFQGKKELEKKNYEPLTFEPSDIDAAIVSHAHLDHIGRLPRLIKGGFAGRIFATPPTIDFARLILEDSVKILEEKARKAGIVPFFDESDVEEVTRHFATLDYYQRWEILPGIFLTFHNAGHVLGSAIIELEVEDPSLLRRAGLRRASKKIVFSGDLGHPFMPLLPAPDFLAAADYVIVESTYGDRNHESPEEIQGIIEKVIEDTIAARGTLMIPSFALERAQQLIYHLNNLVEQKRIPSVPIFIDSPLATRITDVYKTYIAYYNKKTQAQIAAGDDIFKFPGLRFTHSSQESKAINDLPAPKIIIAGSGMSQGGRILHHEARYLGEPQNTLLLVTYQAEGTLGRKIVEGAEKIRILDQEIDIKAKIVKISGYSSHADQKFLMDWLRHFHKSDYTEKAGSGDGVKKIFVAQGEEKSAKVLAGLVNDELGIRAEVPEPGEKVELE